MLAVAYENGGSLLKFGGDALLLWFDGEGHVGARGARHGADALGSAARSGESSFPTRRSRCGWRRACIRDASISSRSAIRISNCWRRARLEPAGRDSARGQRGRDPRERRDGGRASGRVPRRPEGSGPAAATRAAGNVREDSAAPAPAAGGRGGEPRCLPKAVREHLRVGGRLARAPSRHRGVHPLRRHRRADRAPRERTSRPTRSSSC